MSTAPGHAHPTGHHNLREDLRGRDEAIQSWINADPKLKVEVANNYFVRLNQHHFTGSPHEHQLDDSIASMDAALWLMEHLPTVPADYALRDTKENYTEALRIADGIGAFRVRIAPLRQQFEKVKEACARENFDPDRMIAALRDFRTGIDGCKGQMVVDAGTWQEDAEKLGAFCEAQASRHIWGQIRALITLAPRMARTRNAEATAFHKTERVTAGAAAVQAIEQGRENAR